MSSEAPRSSEQALCKVDRSRTLPGETPAAASATAYLALGQNDAALESLERALIADPDLELDPALTSPKVLAVFRAAGRGAARRR